MRTFAVLTMICTLIGCGAVEPLPEDVFLRHRLLSASAADVPAARQWVAGELRVAVVKASGVQRERAVAYSTDGGATLRLHRYLFWLDTPSEMVRQTLTAYLQARGIAGYVVTNPSPATELELSVSLNQFEQMIASDATTMQAEITFQLSAKPGGHSLLVGTYRAQATSADDSPEALAQAMDRAIANIYEQFVNEASALLPPLAVRE
jgi:ABC-type uncharacterized transport system auxiliary subunit